MKTVSIHTNESELKEDKQINLDKLIQLKEIETEIKKLSRLTKEYTAGANEEELRDYPIKDFLHILKENRLAFVKSLSREVLDKKYDIEQGRMDMVINTLYDCVGSSLKDNIQEIISEIAC